MLDPRATAYNLILSAFRAAGDADAFLLINAFRRTHLRYALKALIMKRPLLLASVAAFLGCILQAPEVHARCLPPDLYKCSTRGTTPCGEYVVPSAWCMGDSCYTDRPATYCPGVVDLRGTSSSGLPTQATMRYITTLGDHANGTAAGKLAEARATKLPNQHIVRNVMFTCPVSSDPTENTPPVVIPPVEKPPEPEVKLPEVNEQIYRGIQVVGRHASASPIISNPFDIVVRDASTLSFVGDVPPFSRIVEGAEVRGPVSVYGGEGEITIGMTGAPSWMVLSEGSTPVVGLTYSKTAIASPPAGTAGFYRDIRLTAQDKAGRTLVSPPFTVEVIDTNGLRIEATNSNLSTRQGMKYHLYASAKGVRNWVSFDVIGGPPGINPVEPVVSVREDGSAMIIYEALASQAGVWKDVVFRVTDDQGRVAHSNRFSVTVGPSQSCVPGAPISLYIGSAPPLGFRKPYRWQWQTGEDLQVTVRGDLPLGIGLCTDGTYGLCGMPIANGTWSGEINLANECGGTLTIPFALENQVSDQLRPCIGRFSPNKDFVITETAESYLIGNTKGKEVSFCTPPYNQWDGGSWTDGDLSFSSTYKSSSSYDFIYPSASVTLGYNWYGSGAMSFVYGKPPQEVVSCIANSESFCTDNVVFRASDALPNLTAGTRSEAIYLSGRDWRGRFWGSKKIFVEY